MELVAKITLLFAAFGAIAGCVFEVAPIPSDLSGAFAGIIIFFTIFYVAYKLAPIALKFTPEEFPGGRWTGWTAFKRGFSGFFIMWLVLWIMTHTILVS